MLPHQKPSLLKGWHGNPYRNWDMIIEFQTLWAL